MAAARCVGYGWPWPLSIGARSSPAWSSACCIGFLRAKVRIPSFVVTLALFLAFQGVALYIVNNGPGQHGDVRITDNVVLRPSRTRRCPSGLGWLLAIVVRRRLRRVKISPQRARPRPGCRPSRPRSSRRRSVAFAVVAFLFGLPAQPEPRDQQGEPILTNVNGKLVKVAAARRRGRAVGGARAPGPLLRARTFVLSPHPLRPAHLRGRRQRRGRAPGRHRGRPRPHLGRS